MGKRGKRKKRASRWKEKERIQKKDDCEAMRSACANNDRFFDEEPRARRSFIFSPPVSPAASMDAASSCWSCESPTAITAAVFIAVVVFLLVLFWGTPLAHGGESSIATLLSRENLLRSAQGLKQFTSERDFLDYKIAEQLRRATEYYEAMPTAQPTFEGTVTATGKLVAHVIEAGKFPVEIRGTDVIYVDTKGDKPYPKVSLLELHAKGQAKDREHDMQIEKVKHDLITGYFIPTFILASCALIWAAQVDKKVTLMSSKGGGKSCTPSKVQADQSLSGPPPASSTFSSWSPWAR